jgi:hypothetical protein
MRKNQKAKTVNMKRVERGERGLAGHSLSVFWFAVS